MFYCIPACPEGWAKLSTGCYYTHNKAGINYYDALDFCHSKHEGAYLAMVETPREQKILADHLQGVLLDGMWETYLIMVANLFICNFALLSDDRYTDMLNMFVL